MSATSTNENITVRTLDNGLKLAIERVEGVRSAGITLRVPMGVASDDGGCVGASVINAEVIARGCGELDARGFADRADRLGISVDTGAGSRHTTISMTTLGRTCHEALELAFEMVRHPRFDAEQFDASRDLSLQSLASLMDEPQQRVFHLLRAKHHPSPFDRSTEGDQAGLEAATLEVCKARWMGGAVPGGSILSVAGDVDPSSMMDHVARSTDGWLGEAAVPTYDGSVAPEPAVHHVQDDTDQVHIAFAVRAPSEGDKHAAHERLLNAVLSGGMGARLFTEIREKRGLVYSVSSSYQPDKDVGQLSAYAGTTAPRAGETLELLRGEIARVRSAAGAPSDEEIGRARIGLKSRLVMSGESTGARASALARDLWTRGEVLTLEDRLAKLDAVSNDGLREYAAGAALGEGTVVTLGPEFGA